MVTDDFFFFSDSCDIRRNFADDDSRCPDFGIVADFDRPQYLHMGRQQHIVPDGGMTLAGVFPGAAQRHAMLNHDIITYFVCFPDDDAHAMVDEQTPADRRSGMDLDSGQETPQMRKHPTEGIPFSLIKKMSDIIYKDGM